jgi:Fe(3+) dicitrate transport protein
MVVAGSAQERFGLLVSLAGTDYQTTTDSGGRFALTHVPASRYSLRLQVPGRAALQREVTVVADSAVSIVFALDEGPTRLAAVRIAAARPLHVIGHLPYVHDGVILSGKKSEVIVMDSLHANLAQDVERQILGRIPGAHFSETQGAGFPSNGIGFRGLNPTQSQEVNTRQNGVSIAADLFGYPETYYTPPAEALDRIEVIRGAASLSHGPQFGGVVNYVTKRGTAGAAPTFVFGQTAGGAGFLNSFNSVAGGTRRWAYYGFLHGRVDAGWRPNSDVRQTTGFLGATYRASDRVSMDLELTASRNRIHMPGGLSDEQFAEGPRQSFRARNWLASPWNVAAIKLRYEPTSDVGLETTLSVQSSDRHLVWRNEDGGAAAADAIDPATGSFVPREAERERFANVALESRLNVNHATFGPHQTLAMGVRFGANSLRRFEGGPASTGSDFDMRLYGGTWERALRFRSVNAAVYAEDLVHLSARLSVTPGVRLEYLRSSAEGYTEVASTFTPRTIAYPLVGAGAEYLIGSSTSAYANVSEAYRPILYASQTPFGSIATVDPGLRSSRGYNADLGWRGTAGPSFKFDVSGFYLQYRDRAGTRSVGSGPDASLEIANIGNSRHQGVESYIEIDLLTLLAPRFRAALGTIDLFNSFAYVDARYLTGEFRGNRVEQAPRVVERLGVSWARGPLAMTVQASHTGDSFGDANNSVASSVEDGATGFVPAYTVLDLSLRWRLAPRIVLTGGVNNLANLHYFTKRTAEYPGPGLLPGLGRSIYLGVTTRVGPGK